MMTRREALSGLVAASAVAAVSRDETLAKDVAQNEEAARCGEFQRHLGNPNVIQFEVGKTYRTIGGWDALVVWIRPAEYGPQVWAIHMPGDHRERGPISHDHLGSPSDEEINLSGAPTYGINHPATLMLPTANGGWFFDPTGNTKPGATIVGIGDDCAKIR